MKNSFYLKFLFFLLPFVLVHPEPAAAVTFAPSFYYSAYKTKKPSSNERTTTIYDLKLGTSLGSGVYIGGIYAVDDVDYGTSNDTRTSYGASIGLMQPSWFLLGHYYLHSELESGTVTRTDGSGYQLDLGYFFSVASSFAVGPQLTHRKFEYNKKDTGSATVSEDADSTETLFLIALGIFF